MPRRRNKRRSPCKGYRNIVFIIGLIEKFIILKCLQIKGSDFCSLCNSHSLIFKIRDDKEFWLLQCGLDAFGLQRAGDRQEGGGEEASEPGRQEARAGREAGHGLRQQEVTSLPEVSLQHVSSHY